MRLPGTNPQGKTGRSDRELYVPVRCPAEQAASDPSGQAVLVGIPDPRSENAAAPEIRFSRAVF